MYLRVDLFDPGRCRPSFPATQTVLLKAMHHTSESWSTGPDCTSFIADRGFLVMSALLAKVL